MAAPDLFGEMRPPAGRRRREPVAETILRELAELRREVADLRAELREHLVRTGVAKPEPLAPVGYVSPRQLAAELGVTRAHAIRIAIKLGGEMGIKPQLRQMPDSGIQRTHTWTRAEVDRIIEARRANGFHRSPRKETGR